MEALMKVFEGPADVRWNYDEEADVLYLSIGEPRTAVGVDIGDGLIARYDEESSEVVGVTLVGLRTRLQEALNKER